MSQQDRLIGGRYRIVRKIAEGGMGEVYEAQHNLTKDTIALKILFPHIGKDESARQRFLREVSAPAQIGHDGIVKVTDAGFDPQDGSLFVAMELLDGEPLRDRMAKGGVSLDLLLDWYERILDPLAAAHAKGIVHRDLKPENVFMTRKRDGSEVIKVLDFGIARDLDSSQNNVTHTGIAMGTPHYMAPEQAMSAKGVSAAADVWALGVMLYESLTGRPPFDGETPSAIVVHACTQQHAPVSQAAPHVPRPLADFVDRCLQKDPRDRPQHAGQMLAELRQVRQQIGSQSVLGPMSSMGGSGASVPTGAAFAGPMGGTPPPTGGGYTPAGPAMLPQSSGGAGGTPPPTGGAFGMPPPTGGGYSPAPSGAFGGSPSGFGTPSPTGVSAPGGYGTAPAGAFGAGSGPGAMASGPFVAPSRSSGGIGVGVIVGILVVGLVVVGGGVAAAAILFSGGDDETDTDAGTTGTVRVQTDVQAGELFVDGVSRGPVVPNQQFRVEQGAHRLEIHENGQAVASGTVTVTAGQEQPVTLDRAVVPTPPPTLPPTPPLPTPPPFPTPTPTPTPNDVVTSQTPVAGPVQTFTGSLRRGDATLSSGEYMDTYTFTWTAGSTIRVELDSADFDTYVIVKAPSGQQWDNDDRPSGGLNAGITVQLTETGAWQVVATSYAASQTGDYTLRVYGPSP